MTGLAASLALGLLSLALAWVALRLRSRLASMQAQLSSARRNELEPLSRLESLAESLPQALWFGSSEGRTLFMNRRFALLLDQGGGAEGLDGVEGAVHPEDAARYRDARATAKAAGNAASCEVRLRAADGSYRWWQASLVPRRNASGQLVMWIGSFSDIHAVKEAESELRLAEERYRLILHTSHDAVFLVDEKSTIRFANDTVESVFGHAPATLIGQALTVIQPERLRAAHVAGMSRYIRSGDRKLNWRATEVPALHRDGHEFSVEVSFAEFVSNHERLFVSFVRDLSAQKEAENQRKVLEQRLRDAQKLKAIGTLAGGIAHGINNALAAILGNLQIATEGAAGNPDLRASLDEIQLAARRARALVRQVLLFSRTDSLNHQRCNVGEVVFDIVSLLRGMLPASIQIQLSADEGLPAVLGDPQQIEVALLNLVTNASEAIGEQGGRIDLHVDVMSLAEPEVTGIPGLNPGPHVRLRVRDDGQGIDAETLRRVFEPFFTTGSEAEHAGIGLSVVHGIMSTHRGAVTVDSQPGQGSCFTLYFPVAADLPVPSADAQSRMLRALPAAGTAHILYVDDEPSLVDLMQRLLTRRGYRVTGFTEPDEALAAVLEGDVVFDVVLTDHSMPGMSGIELARELRRQRPELPVAILSGHVSETLRDEATAAGVREVLFKENLVEQLCDRIERFMGGPSA